MKEKKSKVIRFLVDSLQVSTATDLNGLELDQEIVIISIQVTSNNAQDLYLSTSTTSD